MNRLNILVTGGLGYIGSHTCSLLLEEGHNIFILDSLKNSRISVLKNINYLRNSLINSQKGFIKFFRGDIRDINFIQKIFQFSKNIDNSIDIVFHFAGLKSVRESTLFPKEYWSVNVEGTKNLLKVMEQNECKNIIFSSSATVYGESSSEIIEENCQINPSNTYGETKAYAEKVLRNKYEINKDWKIINLRYFNPIGSHKSYLLGEDLFINNENLFPVLCKVANNEINYLEIFGNDWETRDGTCIRDFIHILDIAKGHLSALKYSIQNKGHFLSINLGTAKGTTILELIKVFEEETNNKINYIFTDKRKGDVASYVASNDLAKKYLNWEPILELNEMCIDGWQWYLRNLNLSKQI